MKIKDFIENINPKISERFGNYFITTETMFDIFRLDSRKNVSCYSAILESDLPKFNPSFIYYVEPNNTVYLYAHFTNRIGEIEKIRLGSFAVISNQFITLTFTTSKYKYLIKAIKRALGEKPTKGKTKSHLTIFGNFIIEQRKKYSLPKKTDLYTYVFADNSISTFSKEDAHIAGDIAIKKGIGIKEVFLKSRYEFERIFEFAYLL